VRARVAIQSHEPGSKEIILGLDLPVLLVKGVDLGRERPTPGKCRPPNIVRQADPASDQEYGVFHRAILSRL
jgi:hypothetical protein